MTLPAGLQVESYSDALADMIGDGRVTHALFTTFTFDPGFFELNGLPLLFPDRSFSHVDKAKRIQLEDALREGPAVAVYYDRSGLAQEGTPASLGWGRIDVSRKGGGVFHPKVVLILVERQNPAEDDPPLVSLIVGLSSANITRHGWWENVEVAHFEELPAAGQAGCRTAYRDDLLALLRQLDTSTIERGSEPVLRAIRDFLRTKTDKRGFERRTSKGRYRTRIFSGQDPLPEWLSNLGVGSDTNLEVISPFFDKGHANTLGRLIEATQPKRVRVYVPVDAEGKVLVDREAHAAIAALPNTSWGRLPEALTKRSGNAKAARLSPRRVHAKLYRFWTEASEVVLVGSVNLTAPGHSIARSGNLEAAFLVDNTGTQKPKWWLRKDDVERQYFVESGEVEEDEGISRVPVDVSVEYDWRTRSLRLRSGTAGKRVSFEDLTGKRLFEHEFAAGNVWEVSAAIEPDIVEETLVASSFLRVRFEQCEWRVLVRENNCGYKPSQLSRLTSDEILQYWSLLTPEQKQAFILDKLRDETGEEGLAAGSRDHRFLGGTGLFQRFSGVFHAFGCMRRTIDQVLAEDRVAEAETRLFGKAYDSIPELLLRLADDRSDDVARDYVTMLCARQLRDYIKKTHPEFWRERKDSHARLNDPIAGLESLASSLGLEPGEQAQFLTWYEKAFLTEVGPRGAQR